MKRMEKISLRASAGTGKTYSLVDRYCELLGVEHQNGGAPDQLKNSKGQPEALQPERPAPTRHPRPRGSFSKTDSYLVHLLKG